METMINPIDGAELVLVPAGEFRMGISEEECAEFCRRTGTQTNNMEIMRPQRTIYLDEFWMYRTPVTFGQYRKFSQTSKKIEMPITSVYCGRHGDLEMDDDYPVVRVNWATAVAYCRWAGVQLPTEAQWEKAARGTSHKFYPWGDDWDPKRANFRTNEREGPARVQDYPDGASPYGPIQMSGNVKEWCEDNFAPYGFDKAPFKSQLEYWKFRHVNGVQDNEGPVLVNPTGPAFGFGKVVRGGGWCNANGHWAGLACYRGGWTARDKEKDIGFRPVFLKDEAKKGILKVFGIR